MVLVLEQPPRTHLASRLLTLLTGEASLPGPPPAFQLLVRSSPLELGRICEKGLESIFLCFIQILNIDKGGGR